MTPAFATQIGADGNSYDAPGVTKLCKELLGRLYSGTGSGRGGALPGSAPVPSDMAIIEGWPGNGCRVQR